MLWSLSAFHFVLLGYFYLRDEVTREYEICVGILNEPMMIILQHERLRDMVDM